MLIQQVTVTIHSTKNIKIEKENDNSRFKYCSLEILNLFFCKQ